MDELLEALDDPEFRFFIDDYSFAAQMCAEFRDRPFMERLVHTMRMNSED